ncbi:hypothetical protein H8F24_06465 [Synechococcus sp. CBW1002]|uniref:calcium-binding protein n=1 Tax=Synechococcus sp. CBW1002 TaxID=1353134 RepID=UPI0018CCB5A0|nr:calcium-binding protein [Synechococcus sp. CBW1002]QPN60965.1 hypothetical protein H8F24_06465 [Synechococcus sp. CBW1002]
MHCDGFSTLPGSDSAATTFQGTEGADSIVIFDLPNGSTNFEANGEAGNDFIAFEGSQNLSTIRGGQGNDLITQNIVAGDSSTFIAFNRKVSIFSGNVWSAGLISGNIGDDVIGNNQLGIAAIASTINGGQGDDQLYVGPIQSTLLNGNMGGDFVYVDSDYGSVNINGSSIFGGQGDDVVTVDSGFNDNVNNTVIGGNLGNDTIELDIDGSFAGSVVEGGDGDDSIFAEDSESGLLIFGGNGNDVIYGGIGSDRLFGDAGNDYIVGDRQIFPVMKIAMELQDIHVLDYIHGGEDGDYRDSFDYGDYIVGGDGADSLFGGLGVDTIFGGDLNDILVGGEDGDILSGGTGSNQFRYNEFETDDGSFVSVLVGGNVYTVGVEFSGNDAVDIITDWDAGAGTNVIANNFNIFNPDAVLTSFDGGTGVLSSNFAVGENYAIRGSYNADLDDFTFSFSGNDVLIGVAQDEDFNPLDGFTNNLVVLKNVAFTTTFSQANFI